MQKIKAARRSGNYARAIVRNDADIVADYDRYTLIAGAILGAFFGLLLGMGF